MPLSGKGEPFIPAASRAASHQPGIYQPGRSQRRRTAARRNRPHARRRTRNAKRLFAFSRKGLEHVTLLLYVACRQAPASADDVVPIGTAGPREHSRASWSEGRSRRPAGHGQPRSKPGGGGGGSPARSTVSRVFELWAEGVIYDVLILRFTAPYRCVLILRFAPAGDLSGSWDSQRLYRVSLAAYESAGCFPPGLRAA